MLDIVGERLRSCLRPEDTCARLGADELAVLLERPRSPRAAGTAAGRMLRTLVEPITIVGMTVPITASIGVALGGSGEITEEILSNADLAMYGCELGQGHYFAEPVPGSEIEELLRHEPPTRSGRGRLKRVLIRRSNP